MAQDLSQLIKDHDEKIRALGDSELVTGWRVLMDMLEQRLSKEEVEYGDTPVIVATPEIGRMTTKYMGPFADFIYGKSGGLGDVSAAQCDGLSSRLTPDGKHLPVHLITLNLQKAFREKAGMTMGEYLHKRKCMPHEFIHLVTSPLFAEQLSAYENHVEDTALIFQEGAMRITKRIRSNYGGKGIVIADDWMAGGLFTVYCKLRGIPILDISHNSHTGKIPMQRIYDKHILRTGMEELIYKVYEDGIAYMDSKATGIMDAALAGFVGKIFLEEMASGYYQDRDFIGWPVRSQVEHRYWNRKDTKLLPNGISSEMYPENQRIGSGYGTWSVGQIFKPGDNIPKAKKKNLLMLQSKSMLRKDDDVILLFWPSRLDPKQKGIHLLEEIAMKFVIDHPGVQIAVVGESWGDVDHADIMTKIALDSNGQIFYSRFDESLSMLCYRAADIVFGASLYEPFGQIDVLGWLHGAIHVNRNTSGYKEKYHQMCLALNQDPQTSRGISVLFNDYDSNGLYWGLDQGVKQVKYYRRNPALLEKQQYKLMNVPRDIWSQDRMIDGHYLPVLTELNGGVPLFAPKK